MLRQIFFCLVFFSVTGNFVESFHPFKVMSLYDGGTFDKNYNKRYQPIKFTVPASTKKVSDMMLITKCQSLFLKDGRNFQLHSLQWPPGVRLDRSLWRK